MSADNETTHRNAIVIADLAKQIIADTSAAFPIDIRIAALRSAACTLEQEMHRQTMMVAMARMFRG